MERTSRTVDDVSGFPRILFSVMVSTESNRVERGGFSDQLIEVLGVSCSDATPPAAHEIEKNTGHNRMIEQPQESAALCRAYNEPKFPSPCKSVLHKD